MSTIAGHKLTAAEARVLAEVKRRCDEDTREWFDALDLFPERNNRDNANRRTFARLVRLGVFAACEMDVEGERVRFSRRALNDRNLKAVFREEMHAALDDELDD